METPRKGSKMSHLLFRTPTERHHSALPGIVKEALWCLASKFRYRDGEHSRAERFRIIFLSLSRGFFFKFESVI